MVGIVTGTGLGLERSSGWVLGSRGQLGDATFGRYGENVYVNAATGNLMIDRTDEILIGTGPDDAIGRNYNSLGSSTDDNGDNWRLSAQRQVAGLAGTVNTAGSTVTRTDWDGADVLYTWDATKSAYVSKQGSGAYDTLTFASNVWTWTDGSSRVVETYDDLNGGRITSSKDTDNNSLTYTYTGSLLTRVATADGEYTDLTWSGNNLTQIVTTTNTRAANGTATTPLLTTTRVRYTYDAYNRLSTVTTDLSPDDNSITDGKTVATTYTYVDTTSDRVASISQTGGAKLEFTYTLVGSTYRVTTMKQTVASGVTQSTTFSYDTTNRITTITDPQGQVSKMTYDTSGQLTKVELPPAQSGATAQIINYTYDTNGNVLTAQDASSNTTTYTYDANGNVTLQRDQLGNTVTYTYGAKNELLTATHYLVPDPDGAGAGVPSQPVTTRYAYDAEDHLRFAVSAEGDVTEYQYNAAGQQTSAISYRDNVYDVSALAPTVSLSESTLSTWAGAITDRSTVERTDTTYDFRGNVATVTGYSTASTAGVGSTVTTYTRLTCTYDQFGNMLTRQTSGVTTDTNVQNGLSTNNAPTAGNDTLVVTAVGDSATFDPRINDADLDRDTLTIIAVSTPSHGTASIVNGTLIDYTRTGSGSDSFTYTITDGHGYTATATVAVVETANQTNHAPVASGDSITVQGIGDALTFDPRATDSDSDGDRLKITAVTQPANGTVAILNGGAALLYTCTGSSNGSFTYTITDPSGLTSTATITVTNLNNQAPVSSNVTVYTPVNTPITFDPRFSVTDADNDILQIVGIGTPAGISPHGTASLAPDGKSITYTPAASTSGTDSFTYTVSDGHGHTAMATVSVGVGSGSWTGAVVAIHNDTVDVHGIGSTLIFDPRLNDYSIKATPLTIMAVGTPTHGTATITSDGQIQYTRTSSGTDTFSIAVRDNTGIIDLIHGGIATITVTDTGVVAAATTNQPPVAVSDKIVVNAIGDSLVFDPRVNDVDFDADTITVTTISAPMYGTATVNGNGTITYKRTSAGADSFTYTISDGQATATATVTVTGTGTVGDKTPGSSIHYAYDSGGRLHYAVNGSGEVTEYQRNASGKVTSAIVYHGNTYDLSGFGPTDPISETALTNWIATITDKSTVERTDTTYDFRGNVNTVTVYSAANTGGVGLTTKPYTVATYIYDGTGNLLSRQTSDAGNSEVFTYDGLGRLKSSTDLNGGNTTVAFTDGTNTSAVTMANGLVKTSIYNYAGELISYAESGAGLTTATTTYKYDSRGQLIMATSPNGVAHYYLYDAVGRKVADIVDDGSITEYGYDVSNRLVKTVAYATKVAASNLALLAASSDTAGNPTNPLLATVRPTANATDQWNWNIYDQDDRLIESINGDGDATVFAYDGLSNLTSATSYANKLAVAGFKTTTPVTMQLPAASAGKDVVTRNFYDKDNLLVGVLDGDGYLSQIIYNEAGQKIETISFITVTTAGLRAAGTFAQLLTSVGTNTADIHTRYFYDNRGLLRYTVDDTLHPVEYIYDAAGNLLHTINYAGSITAPSSWTLANVTTQIATTPTGSPLGANANNRKSWVVYDTAGRVAYAIDAMGDVSGYSYDNVGEVTKQVRYAAVLSVSSDQTLAAMISWATTHAADADNRVSRTFYDLAGRAVYGVDPEGYITEYRYNTDDQVTLQICYADVYTVTDANTTTTVKSSVLPTTIPATAVQTSFSHDANGRTQDSYDGEGVRTTVAYNNLGQVTDKTVAYGTSDAATTHYTYDAVGRVASQTAAYGATEASTTSFTYDGLGNVLTKVDGDGFTTSYTYDSLGQVLSVSVPIDATIGNNAVTSYQYDAFGNVIKTTDPRSNVSYAFYDALDRLSLQIDQEGYATATTYDVDGELLTTTRYVTKVTGTITPGVVPTVTTNADDATTTFTRDKLGQVTKVTDAIGNYEQYTLNAFDNRTAVRNKLGGTTTNVFDKRGLLTSETLPMTSIKADGTTEASAVTNTFTYDARGNRTKMVEASGLTEQRTTNYTYDKNDRLITTTHDAVQVVATDLQTVTTVTPSETAVYDKRGNVIQTIDAAGAKTFFYYDDLNRKVASINALGTYSTFTYDDNGNVLTQKVFGVAIALPAAPGGTQPADTSTDFRLTTYIYDRSNRLLTTVVASLLTGAYSGTAYATTTGNVTIGNTYDKAGNVILQTDGNGNNVWFYYDKLGRKVAQVDQELYLTTYALDADGNVTTEKRYATKLAATPAVPPTTTVPTATADATNDRVTNFTYDKNGQRLTETRTGVVAWTVAATNGALTAASTSSTVTYTYNGLGEVTKKTEATGDAMTYAYDTMGRQTSVTSPGYTDYNGTTVTPILNEYYDGLNNLSRSIQKGDGTAGNPDRVTKYTYSAGGRLATMIDASGFVHTYGYDIAGHAVKDSYSRLKSDGTSVTEANAWRYDLLGQVMFQSVASLSGTTWTFGDQSQVLYNAYGEVIAKGVNGMWQETFSYDNGGRMWRSTGSDGVVKLYIYDKNGKQTLEISPDGNSTDAQPAPTDYNSLPIAQADQIVLSKLPPGSNLGALTLGQFYQLMTGNDLPSNYSWSSTLTVAQANQLVAQALGGTIPPTLTVRQFVQLATGDELPPSYELDPNYEPPSPGYSWFTLSIGDAIDLLTNSGANTIGAAAVGGMVVTISAYGARGQQTETIEPLRQISRTYDPTTNTFGSYTTATITTSQTYNAFGEVTSQTDALGNVTSFTYNTEGKIIRTTHPAVSYTDESGTAHSSVAPIENAYYDLSGRLVGTRDAERYSGSDNASGLINTRVLLAGTGYGGTDALTLTEFHADTGKITNAYDVFGELSKTTNALGGIETMTYDGVGRLATDTHQSGLVDTYVYDGLGQRIRHWNSEFGTSVVEKTDYDTQGRVTQTTDYQGYQTTYTYAWSPTLATSGLGTFGGWTKTTYNPAMLNATTHRSETESVDYFGRTVAKTDYGSHSYSFTFDLAARLKTQTLSGTTDTYTYYNTGLLASDVRGNKTGAYQYDKNGNRTVEVYAVGGLTYENETVTWDAMNRMATLSDPGASGATGYSPVSMSWAYDRDGNIRHMTSSYQLLDVQGNVTGSSSENYWYKYDAMNRFVVTMGTLSGGLIVAGTTGQAIAYDMDGNRATTTDSSSGVTSYTYNTNDTVATVKIGGVLRATYGYDAMGRLGGYTEYASDGTTMSYSRSAGYNYDSQLTMDTVRSVRTDGNWVTMTSYDYVADTNGNGSYYDAGDLYQGGVVTHQLSDSYTLPSGLGGGTSDTKNTFTWWDRLVTATTAYNPVWNASTTYTSTYSYDGLGNLTSVAIADGRPRTVSFIDTLNGQVLQRDEADGNGSTGDPRELHYYFNGMAVGDISNNGTSDVDYAASIAEHIKVPGTGPFRDGATSSTSYANFDQSYDPINGLNYPGAPTTYTVQAGDTLQSLAYSLWGDVSFWYLIADANGLNSGDTLVQGQTLSIPNRVHNVHNTSDTYRVYDPNEATGSTSPTVPKPQQKHSSGCAIFGQIISIVIAAVVSYYAGPIAGNIASQAFNLFVGLQDSFSWNSLGLTAITAALTYGFNYAGAVISTGSEVADAAANAVVVNAATQGIGMATGLQRKFDWAGVAAAGVTAGVGYEVGRALGIEPVADGNGGYTYNGPAVGSMDYAWRAGLSGAAGAIAGAATRSLTNGTDFGDNIMAMLPDVIGQTIGNAIAGRSNPEAAPASQDQPQAGQDGGKVGILSDGTRADDLSGMSQVADLSGQYGTAPKSNESFFGWLGDELSSALHWIGNGITSTFHSIGQALGIVPSDEVASTSVETVVVTATRPDSDPGINLSSWSNLTNSQVEKAFRPYSGPIYPVTQTQIMMMMPNARLKNIGALLGPLNRSMGKYGIVMPAQKAAFLAQIGVESEQLGRLSENMDYSTKRLMQVWPKKFPTAASALPYAHNPQALGNYVYANRLGNGDVDSGDGYVYRGGGLLQTTGRKNYRMAGYEGSPDVLRTPDGASDAAAYYWASNGLNSMTTQTLGRADFDAVTRLINGPSMLNADGRWALYQNALPALGVW